MLIDVLYNTDEINKYHCLTTTMQMSGNKEKSDVDTVVDVMKNYLHHYNVIVIKQINDDVLSVVKQAVKAKQDWFKGVYCYKYVVVDGNIVIYIGCTDRYSDLERSVEYVKS